MRRVVLAILASLVTCGAVPAYTPGTGNLYSTRFEAALDSDWEQGNGFNGSPSPWERKLDGADYALYADGRGPLPGSPTRHWARRAVHPTEVQDFSVALELRAELVPGSRFDVTVEQRAPTPRRVRLRIDDAGRPRLARSEGAAMVEVAVGSAGEVPANVPRWLRLAFAADPSGHPRIRVRVWDGGAAAEPGSWDLEFVDTLDTIARVHRLELEADGPAGKRTWVDDLDVYGEPSSGVPSTITEVHVLELSHLDIGFTEPPDEVESFAKSHLDEVLDHLDADPEYRWTIESAWWLDRWWDRSSATERERMAGALRGGRIVLAAGYANLHTTLTSPEALARNAYYAGRMGRNHGFPVRTWITDDVPGSTFALPEILARSGIDYYVSGMNTPFGGKLTAPDHGDRPFWWVGPDGSRVLSWITFDAYAEGFDWGFSFFDDLAAMYTKLGKKIPEQEEAGYRFPRILILRGFDNHYQGFKTRDLVEQWNATYDTPRFVLTTAEAFLDGMLAEYGAEAFPSFSGDFGAAWAGSRGLTPHTHAWERQAHREVRDAEALQAIGGAIAGRAVPEDSAERAYRKTLESDEHSGAGGWPGYFTPEEMQRNNEQHLAYARDARDAASEALADGLSRAVEDLPAAGNAIVVLNPQGLSRAGWVRAVLPAELYGSTFRIVDRGGGAEVPYQRFDPTSEILFRSAEVPGFGYRVYDLVAGNPAAVPGGTLSASPTSLENDEYRLSIDPADGAVASLIHKPSGRELVDGASPYDFNELAASTKAQYDASQAPTPAPPAGATSAVVTSGPLLAEVVVTRTGTPHVETRYRLYRGEDRVEIENVLNRDLAPYVPNSVGTRAYTVTLPFDLHDLTIRTDTATRFLDPVADGFARPNVFDWHNAENVVALHDDSGGVLYAVDAVGAHHLESLSSLASPTYSTASAVVLSRLYDRNDEYEFEGGAVGGYDVEPGTPAVLRYVHHVRATPVAWDPVAALRFGREALAPLRARLVARRPGNLPSHGGSWIEVDAPGVFPASLKPADAGSGVVLRLTELTGVPAVARIASQVLNLANPLRVEHDEDGGVPLAMQDGAVLVPLGPFETATLRIEASPAWAPIELRAAKDPGSGVVRLTWTGGVAPFTVERAESPSFADGGVRIADEQPTAQFDDPVLNDGKTYFYLVR